MPSAHPESRYRRRVLGAGALVAFTLYVIGAPIFNNRIENDLERRVPEALATAGHTGVAVKFSGQDGRIDCSAPLADPEGALDVAYGVRGVHSLELERPCRVGTAPGVVDEPSATTVTTAPGTTTDPGGGPSYSTVGDVVAGDAMFSSLAALAGDSEVGAEWSDPAREPVTLFAPTDEAFSHLPPATEAQISSDPTLGEQVLRGHVVPGVLTLDSLQALGGDVVTTLDGRELRVEVDGGTVTIGGAAVHGDPIVTDTGLVYALGAVLLPAGVDAGPTGEPIAAMLDRGMVTLTGTVASDADRVALVAAAEGAVGMGNVTDQLVADAATAAPNEVIGGLAGLLSTFEISLVAGEAGFDGSRLYLDGNYADPAGLASAQAAADSAGAVADLTERPDPSADQVAALETELNEYVTANPILFNPGSAVLDDSAITIIDYLAAGLRQFRGISVVVNGHTDSDGTADANQTLSEQRAAAVRQALIDRRVDELSTTSQGFGATRPVLVNGIEDKTASRRVEFEITT